jgi:hypothetical protein
MYLHTMLQIPSPSGPLMMKIKQNYTAYGLHAAVILFCIM